MPAIRVTPRVKGTGHYCRQQWKPSPVVFQARTGQGIRDDTGEQTAGPPGAPAARWQPRQPPGLRGDKEQSKRASGQHLLEAPSESHHFYSSVNRG